MHIFSLLASLLLLGSAIGQWEFSPPNPLGVNVSNSLPRAKPASLAEIESWILDHWDPTNATTANNWG